MKLTLRGASGAALILGLAGSFQTALAQQGGPPALPTGQTVATTQQGTAATAPAPIDRVVVRGSVTENREAGELAVEVFTADDLRQQGNPNIVEFVQSLSVVGESVGNMDPTLAMNGGTYTDLYGPGFSNVNLRGLGDADSERTLNLLNGRRTDANANMIPMQALQQIEILKDGASATYGAGAVGGVVNFITRKDFEGVIVEAEYKYIEAASDAPQYELKYTQGWSGVDSNLLLTAAYSHQDGILGGAFDWATQPYEVNPRQWSTSTASTNPSIFYSNTALAGAVPDFTTSSCNAIGGVNPRTGTAHPQEVDTNPATDATTGDSRNGIICYLDNAPFLNVVQKLDTYRAYVQYDSAIDDTMRFHSELSFTKTDAPEIRNPGSGTPSQAQSAMETGGTGSPAGCSALLGRCGYTVTSANPAFADFLTRANVGRGVADPDGAGGLSGSGPIIVPGTTPQPYWAAFWRPFGYGGLYDGQPFAIGSRKEDNWRGTLNLQGEFSEGGFFGLGKFLPKETTYDFAISGATRKGTTTNPDVVSYRLQEALNGFGGPDCHAPDLTPTVLPGHAAPFTAAEITAFNNSIGTQNAAAAGKNGCQFFNPFASAFAGNAATGAANPSYNPALANDPDLVDWLYTDGKTQSRYQELNFDGKIAGKVPGFELPGGKINWGLGAQWRQWDYENRGVDPYMTPRYYDCPWDPWVPAGQMRQSVGGIGCDRTGSSGPGALLSKNPRAQVNTERQIIAGYGELHLPVLDNLNFSGVARYEEISGSIGDWVYQASGKWDITDWLAMRGSYSSNFASPNPDVIDNDGNITVGTVGGTGGPTVPVTTIVDPNLEVETTEQFSVGFLFDRRDLLGQGSSLKASIDYFNYFIEGEVSTLSGSTIVTRAFPTTPTPRVAADCNSSLFVWIELASSCVTGVTPITDVIGANSVVLNGPGIKQAGVDFSLDYQLPLFDGRLGLGVRGTRLLEYKSKAAFYNGVQIPLSLAAGFGGTEDYLGYANVAQFFGTGKQGSRWRASAYASYAVDGHNLRWTTRLVSGVDDERGCFAYAGNGSTTGGGSTCFGVDGEDQFISDFNWNWTLPWVEGMDVRVSILNVFDKEPAPLSGGEGLSGVYFPSLPYNAYISSPLGRQFEIGFAKTF